MVGVPASLARFLTRVSGQGFGDLKYSFTVLQFYWDGEIQFYSSTVTEKT